MRSAAISPTKNSGDPNGIRTRVTAVKGRCPRPLDDRVFEGERNMAGRRDRARRKKAGVQELQEFRSCRMDDPIAGSGRFEQGGRAANDLPSADRKASVPFCNS